MRRFLVTVTTMGCCSVLSGLLVCRIFSNVERTLVSFGLVRNGLLTSTPTFPQSPAVHCRSRSTNRSVGRRRWFWIPPVGCIVDGRCVDDSMDGRRLPAWLLPFLDYFDCLDAGYGRTGPDRQHASRSGSHIRMGPIRIPSWSNLSPFKVNSSFPSNLIQLMSNHAESVNRRPIAGLQLAR